MSMVRHRGIPMAHYLLLLLEWGRDERVSRIGVDERSLCRVIVPVKGRGSPSIRFKSTSMMDNG